MKQISLTPSKIYTILIYIILLGAILFLVIITLFNTRPPLFDEVLFIKNMSLYEEYGLSKIFLLEMYDQAPGPLYQIVHSFLKPLTNLEVPGIRLVNVAFMILVILNVRYILKWILDASNDRLLLSLTLIAVPVMWQTAGMALTELPAMFFVTLSIALIGRISQIKKTNTFSISMGLLAGISLGAAIIGRTPYLLVLPASFILAWNPFSKKSKFQIPPTVFATFAVGAMIICLPIFIIWEGLVPPHQAHVAEGTLKVWHGILAFAYCGLIAFLINPTLFKIDKKILVFMVISYFVLLILNYFWFNVEYQPVSTFLASIFPSELMRFYPHLISPFLMVFALFFGTWLVSHIWTNRESSYHIFIAFCLLFILISCINIKHLFSSRYVAQAAPFIIILLGKQDRVSLAKIVRLLIGILLGYVSLITYVNP